MIREATHEEIADALYERYPTGRKLCKSCGWRLIIDFRLSKQRNQRYFYLEARCRACARIKERGPHYVPPGTPRPEIVKQKISKACQRTKAQGRGILPDKKRCKDCGKWKDTFKDFYFGNRELVSGDFAIHPKAVCKSCSAKRAIDYKAKFTPEEWNAKERQWYKNRREAAQPLNRRFVDPEPFLAWIDGLNGSREISDSHAKRISEARRGASGKMSLYVIDDICTAVGSPGQGRFLYPLEYNLK